MNADTEAKAISLFNSAKTLDNIAKALNVKDDIETYDEPSNEWWNAYHAALERIGAVEIDGDAYYWAAKRTTSGIECITIDDDTFHVVECDEDEAPEEVLEALGI